MAKISSKVNKTDKTNNFEKHACQNMVAIEM